jgi:hypothetical protein
METMESQRDNRLAITVSIANLILIDPMSIEEME